jgi:hypothetical protein
LGDTNDIDVGVVACLEEVLSLEIVCANWVDCGPIGTNLAIGEKFRGG